MKAPLTRALHASEDGPNKLGNVAGVLGARARKLYIAATGVVPDDQDLGLVGVFESLDFLLHE